MSKICRVIINADDFGLTDSCTDAIKDAFLYGIVSDVSLVANGNAFEKATAYADKWEKIKEHTGIHFNLTEGKPLSKEMQSNARFVTNGRFNDFFKKQISNFALLSKNDKMAVYKEFSAQARRLENAGISILHADSHHHIHTRCCISDIFFKVCNEHGIKTVRTYRSVKRTSLPRYVVKKYYLHKCNRYQKGSSGYFGSLNEFESSELGIWEIEVHPDYINDKLVDRKECYSIEDYKKDLDLRGQVEYVFLAKQFISWREIRGYGNV